MHNLQDAIRILAQSADDHYFTFTLLKVTDSTNFAIPFTMGHVMELSLKAAYLACHKEIPAPNHRLRTLAAKLFDQIEPLESLWPSDEAFSRYRELYMPYDSTKREISYIPPNPDEWELAYCIENVGDLKFGLNKSFFPVSLVNVHRPDSLNNRFLRIFNLLRQNYRTSQLDQEISEKLTKALRGDPKTAGCFLSAISVDTHPKSRSSEGL